MAEPEAVLKQANSEDDTLELVSRGAAGDHAAFEVIMRRHNRTLYRTARSILKDDAEAQDAVQDAYVRAYHALAGFRAESSLSTWLTRIVVNESLQTLRRRKRQVETVSAENLIQLEDHLEMAYHDRNSADTPENALVREQARKLLEQKIDALPSAFRTVFVLRALEEMSVEACAEALDVPEATVRSRFFRARKLLRKSLARDMQSAANDAFAFAGDRCDRIVSGVLARLRRPPQSG
jgi:RNA polymerase sigma-70 factor (ECF subfamily)